MITKLSINYNIPFSTFVDRSGIYFADGINILVGDNIVTQGIIFQIRKYYLELSSCTPEDLKIPEYEEPSAIIKADFSKPVVSIPAKYSLEFSSNPLMKFFLRNRLKYISPKEILEDEDSKKYYSRHQTDRKKSIGTLIFNGIDKLNLSESYKFIKSLEKFIGSDIQIICVIKNKIILMELITNPNIRFIETSENYLNKIWTLRDELLGI